VLRPSCCSQKWTGEEEQYGIVLNETVK